MATVAALLTRNTKCARVRNRSDRSTTIYDFHGGALRNTSNRADLNARQDGETFFISNLEVKDLAARRVTATHDATVL